MKKSKAGDLALKNDSGAFMACKVSSTIRGVFLVAEALGLHEAMVQACDMGWSSVHFELDPKTVTITMEGHFDNAIDRSNKIRGSKFQKLITSKAGMRIKVYTWSIFSCKTLILVNIFLQDKINK